MPVVETSLDKEVEGVWELSCCEDPIADLNSGVGSRP